MKHARITKQRSQWLPVHTSGTPPQSITYDATQASLMGVG